MMIRIFLDNGHGLDTPGKSSPIWADGSQLFEWKFNRDIVSRIVKLCRKEGIEVKRVTPELCDISLKQRVHRINAIAEADDLVISVHANAGGGTGYEVYTSVGQTGSDRVAEIYMEEMAKKFPEAKARKGQYADGKEADFYILKYTKCRAILTENFFMDNEKDCRLLMDEAVRQKIAEAHFQVIKRVYYE